MSDPQTARNRIVPGLALAFFVLFVAFVAWRMWPSTPPEAESVAAFEGDLPVVSLELESGEVLIELAADLAPKHVERIVTLANEGFYDGIVFHRVIAGFMAQTGDPTGTGTGGSDLPDLQAEFSDAPFVRGTVGMARSSDPNSANSQFFIVLADSRHLDGQYTLIGRVIEGMDLVDQIKLGDVQQNGLVEDPDHIVAMRVVDSE